MLTEESWGQASPEKLLYYLHRRAGGDKHRGGRSLARKARLLVCACVRHRLGRLTRKQSLALEAAEAFADGLCSAEEMRRAHTDTDSTFWATYAGMDNCREAVEGALYSGCFHPDAELRALGVRVRCVFGNPFRPVTLDPGRLTATVVPLAQAAYDERFLPSGELDLARLAVLSDALEEEGCDEATILDHLRSAGPHVRGCWPLDLILGKR